jgi:hypothetical protein
MILRATALVAAPVLTKSVKAKEAVLTIGLLLSNNHRPCVYATSLVLVVVVAVTLSLKAKEAVLPCIFATSLLVVVAAVTLSLKVKEAV